MDALVMVAAFFFALVMCLGLILVKWIIAQLGLTVFILIVFLVASIFILAEGDKEYEDEDEDEYK